jgi:MFS family permease
MKSPAKNPDSSRKITAYVLLGLSGFLGVLVLTSVQTLFLYFLNQIIGVAFQSGHNLVYLEVIFWIVFVLGASIGGFLIDRNGLNRLLIGGSLLAAVGCLFCGWVVNTDPAQMFLGITTFAIGCAVIQSGLLYLILHEFKSLALIGLGVALYFLAASMAAPGINTLLQWIQPNSLAFVYTGIGMITLAGMALSIGLMFLGNNILSTATEKKAAQSLHQKLPAAWQLVLLTVILVLVSASNSSLVTNLPQSVLLRPHNEMDWDSLQLIFSAPILPVLLILGLLAGGLLSDGLGRFSHRLWNSSRGRFLFLTVALSFLAIITWMLINANNYVSLKTGLQAYAPADAIAIIATVIIAGVLVPDRHLGLASGLIVAIQPVSGRLFNFLESLLIPGNDPGANVAVAFVYILVALVLSLVLAVPSLSTAPTASHEKPASKTPPVQ